MRHIDIERLAALLPEGWEERATQALVHVEEAIAEDRSAEVRKRSAVWRDLAGPLGSLSHGKCWYCETRQIRSDMPVDHFRPKARPVEAEGHPGYWWRAFTWRNFRYSCTYCNSKRVAPDGSSGGKHDRFPLLDEAKRAFDEQEIAQESPVLLDPIVNGDPGLLYFDDEGRAQPRIRQERHEVHWRRADESIELYHLNHEDTVEQRRALFNSMKRLIRLGKTHFDQWQANDPSAKDGFEYIAGELRKMLGEDAEFSAAARDMLSGFRDNQHPWIDGII